MKKFAIHPKTLLLVATFLFLANCHHSGYKETHQYSEAQQEIQKNYLHLIQECKRYSKPPTLVPKHLLTSNFDFDPCIPGYGPKYAQIPKHPLFDSKNISESVKTLKKSQKKKLLQMLLDECNNIETQRNKLENNIELYKALNRYSKNIVLIIKEIDLPRKLTIPLLTEIILNDMFDAPWYLASFLRDDSSKKSIALLILLLHDNNPKTRYYATLALSSQGTKAKRALPALKHLFFNGGNENYTVIINAIKSIGGKAYFDRITEENESW